MLQVILTLLAKFWKPISIALGSLTLYFKGRWDKGRLEKAEKVKAELDAHKRLRNVKDSTTRDSALERLRKAGRVRDDKPVQ